MSKKDKKRQCQFREYARVHCLFLGRPPPPVTLPDYLTFYNGNSRLRSSHLDHLSLECSLLPRNSLSTLLEKSFFYRTHTVWNSLPLELREVNITTMFRTNLEKYLWKEVLELESSNWEEFG